MEASTGSRLHPLGGALSRTLIGGAVLAVLLATPPAYAAPSASCCFTGPTSTCLDGWGRNLVCDLIDPYCCNTHWDNICVQEYQDWVGYTCPPLFHGSYLTPSQYHDAEISEFGEDVCGGVDPHEYQWTAVFDIPANRFAGSTTTTSVTVHIDDSDEHYSMGSKTAEIFSNTNGVLHGILKTDWFGDLRNVCDEPTQGLRFVLVPYTNKSCYSLSSAPGCQDRSIEAHVCHNDPYCCTTSWDQMCVNQAHDSPSHL